MLADTLAWAVSHNIPITEALRSLPLPAQHVSLYNYTPYLSRFFAFNPLLGNIRWSDQVNRLITTLKRGKPLSVALHECMGKEFPSFFYLAIAKAEQENRLETALPLLAVQMNYPASIARKRKLHVYFAASKIIPAIIMLSFLLTEIVPKFGYILEDLIGNNPKFFRQVPQIGAEVLGTILSVFFVLLVMTRLGAVGEYILLHIPYIGKEMKRTFLADLARGMAVFIRQGEDMIVAAEWNIRACKSYWLKQKLRKFIESLRGGTHWVDAWNRMYLGRPLEQWMLRNASSREDPASGFELMSEWLHEEIELTTNRIERWTQPIVTVIVACLVGYIAYTFFSMLTKIVITLSN